MVEVLVALAAGPFVLAYLVASCKEPLRIALPVYAFLLPFGSSLSVGSSSFGSLSSAAGLVLTAGLLAQLMTSRSRPSRLPAAVPVWLMFFGVAAASTLWSIAPRVTIESVAVLGSLVALYALLAVSGIDRRALVRTENAIILGSLVTVGYAMLQLTVLGGLPSSSEGAPRFGNSLLGPNNQAAALLLPLAITTSRTVTRRGVPDRLLHGLAAGLLLVGILATGSRGGLLAAVVTMGLVVLLAPRGRRMLLITCAVGTVLVAALLLLNPAGIGARQVNQAESSSGRTEIWRVGMHACETICLTGSGWGTFAEVYAQERASVPDVRVLRRGTAFEPHNLWLLAAVEGGFVGLLLMTAGLALPVVDGMRLPKALRGPPVAALVGTIVAGVFLSNLEFKFFWMVLAYVALTANSTALLRGVPGAGGPARLPAASPGGRGSGAGG